MSIPPNLFDLVPTELTNRRPDRFVGKEFGVALSAFGPADQKRLRRLYAAVSAAARGLRDPDPVVRRDRLLAVDGSALIRDADALGTDTPESVTGEPRVRRLLHDVRGGGLQVLLGTAELIRFDPHAAAIVPNAAACARDHAKIMRAGFPDLDPLVYADDEAEQVHAIDGFAAAWHGSTVRHGDRTVTVRVECAFDGAITSRCLETASIDRVLYNYANNAIRFAADGRVTIWIFRVGADLIRWVVHNAVSADDRGWLERATRGDMRTLFRGGTSNGGNGVGLSGCAEIVAECFGLEPAEALDAGHLGARADATNFHAWFHWPVYAPAGVRERLAECACQH